MKNETKFAVIKLETLRRFRQKKKIIIYNIWESRKQDLRCGNRRVHVSNNSPGTKDPEDSGPAEESRARLPRLACPGQFAPVLFSTIIILVFHSSSCSPPYARIFIFPRPAEDLFVRRVHQETDHGANTVCLALGFISPAYGSRDRLTVVLLLL